MVESYLFYRSCGSHGDVYSHQPLIVLILYVEEIGFIGSKQGARADLLNWWATFLDRLGIVNHRIFPILSCFCIKRGKLEKCSPFHFKDHLL